MFMFMLSKGTCVAVLTAVSVNNEPSFFSKKPLKFFQLNYNSFLETPQGNKEIKITPTQMLLQPLGSHWDTL